tara:strand:+ start:2424 stop:2615 length:192 start_codon:yes stop_codon:yes gene_type:complete
MAATGKLAEEFGAVAMDGIRDPAKARNDSGVQALMKRRDILPVGWMAMLSSMINPTSPRARSS